MTILDDVSPAIANALVVVGGIFLAKTLLSVVYSFYVTFLRSSKNLKKYGAWAVVTGATDGIGKAMSLGLAKKGLNVLLISRTESKLMDTSAELKSKHPNVAVEHLAIDFSKFDAGAQAKVAAAIADKDVGVLVNNVGVSYPYPKYFNELTDDEIKALLEININSTVWMTRITLPGMITRKRGAIVNFASGAALMPAALLAGYSAAKSFIVKLSEAMNIEMAPKGVHVQCQAPLLVATKLSKIRRPKWDTPSPATYAKSGVAAIGYEAVVSPYWAHKLQVWAMGIVPGASTIFFNMHKGLRARALKKLAAKVE